MSEFSIQSLTGGVNSYSTAWKILSTLENSPYEFPVHQKCKAFFSVLKNHPKIEVVSKHATRLRRVVFDNAIKTETKQKKGTYDEPGGIRMGFPSLIG